MRLPHGAIDFSFHQQLFVRATCRDSAVLEHEDLIRVHDRLQPVRDNNECFIFRQRINGALQFIFILRICKGSCLVENNDRSVL